MKPVPAAVAAVTAVVVALPPATAFTAAAAPNVFPAAVKAEECLLLS